MITGDVFDYLADTLVFSASKNAIIGGNFDGRGFYYSDYSGIYSNLASCICGTFHGYGFTDNFIPNYLSTYCKNFVMALPLQLIIVEPFARFIFRSIFRKK